MRTRLSLVRSGLCAVVLALSAAPAAWSQAAGATGQRATLTIRVHKDATLTVDDKLTKQTGAVRRFYSPPLEPGRRYHYTIVSRWNPRYDYETYIARRVVRIEAGTSAEVDLRVLQPEKGDTIEIIYVPTPQETVDAMMKLAKVGKDDVVYDLGCGDGRIVITAVKNHGARRGVGVDREPDRIKEARKYARQAGVEDRVEFRQGDVFQVKDIAKATVVMLYLSDDLNEKLRQTLFKQLRPGTRIVSHRFLMGDWKPEKTEKVDVEDDIPEEKLIHLWTIRK